jgi:DNA invertase Pin-like site-specific DNA recombinase
MGRPGKVTPEQVERMRALERSGMSKSEIARVMGIGRGSLDWHLMTPERHAELLARRRERKRKGVDARFDRPSMSRRGLSKVELTDEDRRKLRVIHAAQCARHTPEEIDRAMHWQPGETLRQLEGAAMATRQRRTKDDEEE